MQELNVVYCSRCGEPRKLADTATEDARLLKHVTRPETSGYCPGCGVTDFFKNRSLLAQLMALNPPGWSIVAQDRESGNEWGFGYYWPIASRAHEYRLPGARVTTVHRFAGASQGRAASVIIHWQELQGIKIKWNFLDRTIDEVLLSSEQAIVKRQTGSAICLYHDSNAVAWNRLSLVSI